jgi:adenylate cyclase
VISRSSTFTYKGRDIAATQVGRELGVRYVLEGSVQRGGNKVRVNAQLIDAQTGNNLWAERFDGDTSDLLGLQDLITSRIANSIGVSMVDAEAHAAERRDPNPDSADLVLRAAAVSQRPQSIANLQEAERLFRRALALDPVSVSAKRGLARSLILQNLFYRPLFTIAQDYGHNSEAVELIEEVLTLQPRSADAHNTRGLIFANNGLLADQIQQFETAIVLDPNYVEAYANLANSLILRGQPEKAIQLAEEAFRRSPRDPNTGFWYLSQGRALLLLGQYNLAIDKLLAARAEVPEDVMVHLALAAAYAQKDDMRAAQVALGEAIKIQPELSVQRVALYSGDANFARLAEATLYAGLRKAGLREYSIMYVLPR